MKFRVTLGTHGAPELFDRFLSIIGPEPWRKRYRNLLQQAQNNPLMRGFIGRRHVVELITGDLLKQGAAGRPIAIDLNSRDHYTTFSFVAGVVLIYDGLSDAGKKRLAGSLLGGLNTDQGMRPLQNELETATHLMNVDFDVVFNDLEGGVPGFDFLATRDGVELEVECKSVSGDLGRQVHERRMADLSAAIQRQLQTSDAPEGGWLVRLKIPARLPSDPATLEAIAGSVIGTIAGGPSSEFAGCRAELIPFDLAASPFSGDSDAVTEDVVRHFTDEQLGSPNPSVFVAFAPRKRAIVVAVESDKRDRVVGQLIETLKDVAKGQFSGSRAAILVVHFLELDADAMLELARHDQTDPAKAPALQLATNLFFRSEARSHIHTVVYRSRGTLNSTALAGVQEQGPTYSFTNRSHAHGGDPRYMPFRVPPPTHASGS